MTSSSAVFRFRSQRSFVLALSLLGAVTVAPGAAEVTYVLAVANGRVPENMRLIRVKQNDVVRLEWRTDKPMSVHLHGYDIEQEIKPGAVTDMTFTARATGRFTIEPHVGKTQAGGHAHGDVLVTIEIYP
jgi:FtsP/CotA-like multicopper oxidase with cupredoxin domain